MLDVFFSLVFNLFEKVNVVVNSCLISKIAFPIYVGINNIFLNYICEKRENQMRTRRENGEGGETRDAAILQAEAAVIVCREM